MEDGEKIDTKYSYEERTKILKVRVIDERTKDNGVVHDGVSTFTEPAIRRMWAAQHVDKEKFQAIINRNKQLISTSKDQIKEFKKLKKPELNERQKILKKDMDILAESKMMFEPENRIKVAEETIKIHEVALTEVNKDINELRSRCKNLGFKNA